MKKYFLATAAISTLVAFNAFAAAEKLGSTNVYWEVVQEGDETVLKITGSGKMPTTDYNKDGSGRPWGDYLNKVTKIEVAEGVTSITGRAFQNMPNVSSVDLPESLTSIGITAFKNNTSLTSLTIPSNVTSVGNWAFQTEDGKTSSLQNLVIGNKVTSIGENAFQNATNLQSLTIGDSVKTIGKNAFENASSITSLTIPDSVTSIGTDAFKGASSLKYLKLSDNLTTIETHAFENAISLEKLKIPASVKTINEGAFSRATSLTEIDFGGVETIGVKSFAYAFSLESLVIPDTVKTIGNGSFVNATSLKELVLGDGITSLGKNCFSTDNTFNPDPSKPYTLVLEKLTIGKNLTDFGTDSFKGAPITELTIDAEGNNFEAIANFFKNRQPPITTINCMGGDRSVCEQKMQGAGWDISGLAGVGNVAKPAATKLTDADIQPKAAQVSEDGEGSEGGDEQIAGEQGGSQGVSGGTQGAESSTNLGSFDRSSDVRTDRRIYTPSQAAAVAGVKNTVVIRYK